MEHRQREIKARSRRWWVHKRWGRDAFEFFYPTAFFRDAGAQYNDIVFWSKPSDWKVQLTTPNASSLYVYFNFNTKDGPVVLDFPAAVGAGLFGTLCGGWQVPRVDVGPKGEDEGKGGKYLLLPPDFTGEPPAGYIVVRSATYNGYALFRAIPASQSEADIAKAVALVKKQRLYQGSGQNRVKIYAKAESFLL